MTLYLDTEFNGHGGELISIALVSDKNGMFFYEVAPLPKRIDPWVMENVIPKLDKPPIPLEELRSKLRIFLTIKHPKEKIIADWPYDFTLLTQLMCGDDYGRSWMCDLTMILVVSDDRLQPKYPHNALSDAYALMQWDLGEVQE